MRIDLCHVDEHGEPLSISMTESVELEHLMLAPSAMELRSVEVLSPENGALDVKVTCAGKFAQWSGLYNQEAVALGWQVKYGDRIVVTLRNFAQPRVLGRVRLELSPLEALTIRRR
jgi:hypothetical protein